MSGDNHNQSGEARRWKCCPCCEPGGIAFADHQPIAEGGSYIDKDNHDGPCDIHQGSFRASRGEVSS